MSAISGSYYDNIRIVKCGTDQAESKIWLTLTLEARALIREMVDKMGLAELAIRIDVKESRIRNWMHVKEKNNTTCLDIQTARKVNACFKPAVVFPFDIAHLHSFGLEEGPKQTLRKIKSVDFLIKYTGFKRGKINVLKSKKRAPETITVQDAATLSNAVKKINRFHNCGYPIPEFEIKLKETDEISSLEVQQTEMNPEINDPRNSSFCRDRDQRAIGEMQITPDDYNCVQVQDCNTNDDESKAWFKLTLQARHKIRTMTAPELALKTGINVNLIKSWRTVNSPGTNHVAFIDVQLARKVNECFKPDIVFPLDSLHLHSFEIDSKAREMISKIPIPSICEHTRFKVSKVSNWRTGHTKNITIEDAITLHNSVKNNLLQYKPPIFVIKFKNLEQSSTPIHLPRGGNKRTLDALGSTTDQGERPTKRIKISFHLPRGDDKRTLDEPGSTTDQGERPIKRIKITFRSCGRINNQEMQHSVRSQTQDHPTQDFTVPNVREQTVSNNLSDEEFFDQLPQIDYDSLLIFDSYGIDNFKKFDVQ